MAKKGNKNGQRYNIIGSLNAGILVSRLGLGTIEMAQQGKHYSHKPEKDLSLIPGAYISTLIDTHCVDSTREQG